MTTAPTATTVALSLAISPASSSGSLLSVAAATIAASNPIPPVLRSAHRASCGSLRATPSAAPRRRARSAFWGSTSMPNAKAPAAETSWQVSCPISPSPITATRSPTVTPACRSPCIAMEPRVANAASSGETPSGTFAARFFGTNTTSACAAYRAPAQATMSPTPNSSAPRPTSSTSPAHE